jgi:hypothetical protein
MWIYSTLDRNFAKVSGETLNSCNLLKTVYLMDVGDRIGGFLVASTEFQSCLFRKLNIVHHLAPDSLRQRLGLALVISLAAKKMLGVHFIARNKQGFVMYYANINFLSVPSLLHAIIKHISLSSHVSASFP